MNRTITEELITKYFSLADIRQITWAMDLVYSRLEGKKRDKVKHLLSIVIVKDLWPEMLLALEDVRPELRWSDEEPDVPQYTHLDDIDIDRDYAYELIDAYLKLSDIRELSRKLGVTFSSLGNRKAEIIESLLEKLILSNRIDDLVNTLYQLNPFVQWVDISNYDSPRIEHYEDDEEDTGPFYEEEDDTMTRPTPTRENQKVYPGASTTSIVTNPVVISTGEVFNPTVYKRTWSQLIRSASFRKRRMRYVRDPKRISLKK